MLRTETSQSDAPGRVSPRRIPGAGGAMSFEVLQDISSISIQTYTGPDKGCGEVVYGPRHNRGPPKVPAGDRASAEDQAQQPSLTRNAKGVRESKLNSQGVDVEGATATPDSAQVETRRRATERDCGQRGCGSSETGETQRSPTNHPMRMVHHAGMDVSQGRSG
ncbi:uncharacterized protein N7459_003216 [Penicillium hispanicum]|uniref:uncharacterized protein n=1 Tax=Penicillium hispanicum TaxID=1080232 RepID=UPI0025419E56|nr:uncharacterized protein N7459_003216 [Penicillium hispanicum]KAJ5587451.1 hypothetical protein N7459_003216 [Penicillium hispanicum]